MTDFDRNHEEPDHDDHVTNRTVKLTGAIVFIIIILSVVILDTLDFIGKWG